MPTLRMPSAKQRRSILHSTARINIWDGAVRSSKTIGSLIRWLDYVDHGPDGALLMMAKTERSLTRNVLHPLGDLLGPGELRISSGSGEARLWGRRIYLAGAADERAEEKLRGLTLAGAYGDEITTWPESAFKMLLSRLSEEDAKFFGTTNPEAPTHWLMDQYLARVAELDLARFHFTLDDNPFLSPTFVASLKKEYVGLWYDRYIRGEWTVAEGAVYDMLDEEGHLVDQLPELIETWDGIDYGTTNPTVFLAISLGVDGCLYVHDEWRWDSASRGRQQTDAEYSAHLQAWHAQLKREPRWTFIDPSAASFIQQLYRDKVRGMVGADNSVLDGIREVSTLLGLGRLKFHRPTTKAAWSELVSYVWDSRAQKAGEDKPLKVDDHAPDALRYAIRGTRTVWHPWLTKREEITHAAP